MQKSTTIYHFIQEQPVLISHALSKNSARIFSSMPKIPEQFQKPYK